MNAQAKTGIYRTRNSSLSASPTSWNWERVGLTVYASNLTTNHRTTFSSLAELKRYAETGRR